LKYEREEWMRLTSSFLSFTVFTSVSIEDVLWLAFFPKMTACSPKFSAMVSLAISAP
jgi:hypothetical protein